jgi:predicted Zn-dependent protease
LNPLSETSRASATLPSILALYDRGLYVRSWELLSRDEGEPPAVRRPSSRAIVRGRLLLQLGAPRRGSATLLRAFRSDPGDEEAFGFACYRFLERHGPVVTHRRISARLEAAAEPPGDPESARARAHLLAMRARVAACLRDFEAADEDLEAANRTSPGDDWIIVERAAVLEHRDLPAAALSELEQLLARRPHWRPAVQVAAHLRALLGRQDAAIELLRDAAAAQESAQLELQLASLLLEARERDGARRAVERCRELAVAAEPAFLESLSRFEAEIAYRFGDVRLAVEISSRRGGEPGRLMAERLLAAGESAARRVQLPVEFVRQDFKTCAPATLTAIAGYFGREAEHLEVVEEICYDGTPAAAERRWAERFGFAVREFTVDWDTAVSLVDRGLPFTITSVDTNFAHLQALVGYDTARGTFLLRDSNHPAIVEVDAAGFLRRYSASGPRGMLMIPESRAGELAGLRLPDAPLHDRLHRLLGALLDNRRDVALEELAALRSQAPDHFLTLVASRSLAAYDGDSPALLEATERLAGLYPESLPANFEYLAALERAGRGTERRERLENLAERHGGSEPAFLRELARELCRDARTSGRARDLVGRVLRRQAADARAHEIAGRIEWLDGVRAEALRHYRWAACLDPHDEYLASTYSDALRWSGRGEEGLEHLRRRVQLLGGRASQPAATLHRALVESGRLEEADARLAAALERWPEDGGLLLVAASAAADQGQFARAHELLAAARGRVPPGAHARAAAHCASLAGDIDGARIAWESVLEVEPLAMDAISAVVRIEGERGGRPAAIARIEEIRREFPHHAGLSRLELEWLAGGARSGYLRGLDAHLRRDPRDAWAIRERALVLLDEDRPDEAAAELERAAAIEPRTTSTWNVRAQVLCRTGDREGERRALRTACEIDANNSYALRRLVDQAATLAERREALRFAATEILRQHSVGEGVITFQFHAARILEPAELLQILEHLVAQRPDVWEIRSAWIRQLIANSEPEPAIEASRASVARFPMEERAHLDLAAALCSAGRHQDRIAALEAALLLRPTWTGVRRELAGALLAAGDSSRVAALLEDGLRLTPFDILLRQLLAELRLDQGRDGEGLEIVASMLQKAPAAPSAWDLLARVAGGRNAARAVALARETAAQHPGNPEIALGRARVFARTGDTEAALAATRDAVRLAPREVEGHDYLAFILASAGRFEEAEAACRPSVFGSHGPVELSGRSAWVLAESGRLAQAIERMTAVVDENPAYFWGHLQLANWCARAGQTDRALRAYGALLDLEPADVELRFDRARLLLDLGRTDEARRDLEACLGLRPADVRPAQLLFDLHFAADRLDDAAAVLSRFQTDPDAFTLARAVQLAAARGDEATARRHLRSLLLDPAPGDWALAASFEAFERIGWRSALEEFERRLAENLPPAELGPVWVRAVHRWGNRSELRKRLERLPRSQVASEAAAEHLAQLFRLGWRADALGFLAAQRELLAGDDASWGRTGVILAEFGCNREAERWLEGWREREQVSGQALLGLSVSRRSLGFHDAASDADRAALELPPDWTTPLHHLWLAADAVTRDDDERLAFHLSEAGPAPDEGFYGALALLVTSAHRLDLGLLLESDRRYPFVRSQRPLRRLARIVARRLSRRLGSWRARRRYLREVLLPLAVR